MGRTNQIYLFSDAFIEEKETEVACEWELYPRFVFQEASEE